MRPEPLVMTTKLTVTRMAKTMMPMTKLPPITKLPNASMTWPAASEPSWPCDRISRVEARLSESRSIVEINRMVGNDENSSGAWMNSEVIRIRIDSVRGQAQAQHHQDGEDAERQRDIAAPQDFADVAETGKSGARCCAETRRDIDHGCCFPPRMPAAGAKRLRGGRRATVSKVRHRTGVHGYSPVLRDRRHSTSLGNFCPVYG